MQKWEYLELSYKREDVFRNNKRDMDNWVDENWVWADKDSRGLVKRLNDLGNEGWELISVYTDAGMIGTAWAGRTTFIYYILKRPKN